jgi:hypothetical protein
MRHEPYQSHEGEIFTLLEKQKYVLFRRLNKKNVRMEVDPFGSFDDAASWVEHRRVELQAQRPKERLTLSFDYDD